LTKIFNNSDDTFFKIGNRVPNDSVNVSYYRVPELTPKENVSIINEALAIAGNINDKYNTADELVINNQGFLTKNETDKRTPAKENLEKVPDEELRYKKFLFKSPPASDLEVGEGIEFYKINYDNNNFEKVSDKVDKNKTNLELGEVYFDDDLISEEEKPNFSDIEIEVRYILEREEQVFGEKDFAITNRLLDYNGNSYPLYYKYKAKYLHQDVLIDTEEFDKKIEDPDNDEYVIEQNKEDKKDYIETMESNIIKNIDILDSNENIVKRDEQPYLLNLKDVTEDYYDDENTYDFGVYEIEIFFSFNPNEDDYYLSYNPMPDVLVSEYDEIINAEPIFKEVDQETVYQNFRTNKKIYSTVETPIGYKVLLPDKAKEAQTKEEKIVGYMDSPRIPFNYQVQVKGRKAGEENGIHIVFMIDNSGFINDDINDFDDKKESMEYLIKNLIEETNGKISEQNSKDVGQNIKGIYEYGYYNSEDLLVEENSGEEIEKIINYDNFTIDEVIVEERTRTVTRTIEETASFRVRLGSLLNPFKTVTRTVEREIEEEEVKDEAMDRGRKVDLDQGASRLLNKYKSNENGYKRICIYLSTGESSNTTNTASFRSMKKEIKRDNIFDNIYTIQFGGDGESKVEDGLKAFSYNNNYFKIESKSDIDNFIDECLNKDMPQLITKTLDYNSSTVTKFNSPKRLCNISGKITNEFSDENAELRVLTQSPREDDLNFFYKKETPNRTIKREINDRVTYIDTNEDDRISVYAKTDVVELFSSESYYATQDADLAQISVSIDDDLGKHDYWNLTIKNGRFTLSDYKHTYKYSLPEFEYENVRKTKNGEKVEIHKAKVAEKIDSYNVKLPNGDLYIKTEEKQVSSSYDYVKGSQDHQIDGDTTIIIPKNIKLYNQDDEEYTIINWDKTTGELQTLEYISETHLYCDYENYIDEFEYRGYFDENDDFVHLDLNPRRGHTYMEKDRNTGKLNEMPSSNLYDETVFLYLIPEYVTDRYDDILKGSRTQNALFHTIGSPIFQNDNRPLHPYVKHHIESGHFDIDDILLIAKIYVSPISNPELINMTDTRTRGGGLKEDKIEDLMAINPSVEGYWDIGQYDGKIYPSNGVNIIEIPERVRDVLSEKEIEEKIQKHFPLGGFPIIKYVDEEE